VKVNQELHIEILSRYQKLGLAPYAGFINPEYTPVIDINNEITDINISYPDNFTKQMLKYSDEHSYLPIINN